MRLNLYVACCSALVYFGNAMQLQENVPVSYDEASDFAQVYQDEYATDLAETYSEKDAAAKAKVEAAKVKAEAKLTKATS